jgi:glucosamine kinase
MRVAVISDAEAAYRAALGEAPGILVVAGTGSMAVGRAARGGWRRAGGLGPLLGDEGSAFCMGRQWLRLMAQDGDISRARRLQRGNDAVARIAALAPMVLRKARRGNRRARGIVFAAQCALAWLVLTLARDLGLPTPLPVSWAGGLLADTRFRAGVWRAVERGGFRIACRPPLEAPVEAAARLARSLR